VAQVHSDEVVAEFIHQLRQPLSALEALTSYLDLITPAENKLVHEQLRRMHVEVDQADQILKNGLRTLGAYFSMQQRPAEPSPAVPPEGVVEELSRPLTRAAMASVTY
jgi:signal transduction histidine kinase